MALIKCPECGREISDKSKQCIHCGYPIEQANKNTTYAIYLKNIIGNKNDKSRNLMLCKIMLEDHYGISKLDRSEERR